MEGAEALGPQFLLQQALAFGGDLDAALAGSRDVSRRAGLVAGAAAGLGDLRVADAAQAAEEGIDGRIREIGDALEALEGSGALGSVGQGYPEESPSRGGESDQGLAAGGAIGGCDRACGDAAFLTGYREYGGPAEYERHLLDDVLPCEGGPEWGTGDYGNGYRSRAQFHPDSWRTAELLAGYGLDDTDPHDVGIAVAVWLGAISEPGGTGGWPSCWWVGTEEQWALLYSMAQKMREMNRGTST